MNLKRNSLLVLGFCLLASGLQAQQPEGRTHAGRNTGQAPFPVVNYQELDNPVPVDMDKWKAVHSVLLSWGDTDVRYKKEEPALTKIREKIELVAWKGERVSAQFVVWGNRDLSQLSFEVSDLKHRNRPASIAASRVFRGFVRYVMTDELNQDGRGGCGHRPDAALFDSTLVADPIDHLSAHLAVPAYATQGGWIRVAVPQDALPGTYAGQVTVRNGKEKIGSLTLEIKVRNHTLPPVSDWAFHLDLWQNPFAIARYHQVKLWSKEHLEVMKPYMELYRDAGGKVITASIMHKPWNGQTYDYFESMVTWIKKLDGTWSFDYAVFDRWVQFMLDLGIDKQINCYSMVPWKLSFQYFDQATNRMQTLTAKSGEAAYEELWTAMLSSFADHLKEKGWFDRTFISMDERPMEVMQQTIQVIRRANPDFRISLAGALHEELAGDLDDYCVALRMKYPAELLARRKAEGKVTTFYTSCEEPYPNTFTFCAPADCEWFGWYAARAGLDGYLRWALNSWVIEPLLDSRFYTWAAGDTYLIYPGARTSIRFERLVAGIQAYEKVRILREKWQVEGSRNNLKKLEKVLDLFDEQHLPEQPSAEVVRKAHAFINRY